MTKEEIATILKNIRVTAGLTQKEVAEKLGKKQPTIASWESGQSQPDANTLFLLCALYGTTVDVAFGFHKESLTTEELDLIKKYRTLDEYGKRLVREVIDLELERVS